MSFKFAAFFAVFWLGYESGKHIGFVDGEKSANFDRSHANKKLDQCLRIVRSE
jgi:hypothetical protein